MERRKKNRIVIVDDQRLTRMYMEQQIQASSHYEIVASLPLAEEAVAFLARESADLLLLDVVMERGEDGLVAAAKIKRQHPKLKIVLCTSLAETEWMARAKEIGVESFWYKEFSQIPLLEVIDRTVDGESVYSDEVPESYLGLLPVSELNARQREILRYLIVGYTNRKIAEKTGLTANTVKSYIDDMMSAADIHSRTGLAVAASQLGLSVGG